MKLNRLVYLIFRRINIYTTIFIFAFMGLIGLIGVNVSFLDPIEEAFSDFELTDLIFSEFREKKGLDKNIILVNIGNLDRRGIAQLLNRINEQEPKVVGIDSFFRSPKGAKQDFPLSIACRRTDNLVLVSQLHHPNVVSHHFDSLSRSHPLFSKWAESGFANLISGGEDGFRTTRLFTPVEKISGEEELSFPVKILQKYDSTAYAHLRTRKHKQEIINFSGNMDHFFRFDYHQVLDTSVDLSVMEGKIVLLGYMGGYLGEATLTDIFYTPLNGKTGGRSYPDMYGVVVHANIISQALRKDFIQYFPRWFDYFIGVIFCFLNVAFFTWISDKFKVYYDLVTKIVQLFEVTIMVGVSIAVFHFFNFKLDLSFAMITVALCGDLTEVYTASIHDMILMGGSRFRRAQEKMHLSGKFKDFERKAKAAQLLSKMKKQSKEKALEEAKNAALEKSPTPTEKKS